MLYRLPLLIILYALLSGACYLKAYTPLMGEWHYFHHKKDMMRVDLPRAEKRLLKALSYDPQNTVWLYGMSTFYGMTGQTDKAVQYAEKARHWYNGDIVRWAIPFQVGLLKMQLGSLLEARNAFQEALRFNPEFGEARVKLAEVEGILKEHDQILIKLR